MDTLSQHLLIELWECQQGTNDPELVRRALTDSVRAIHATIVAVHVHTFSPQGVTGVAVLAESHMSIHTWPEHDYVAADIFTCGESTRPLDAVEVLREMFASQRLEIQQISRGLRTEPANGHQSRNSNPGNDSRHCSVSNH